MIVADAGSGDGTLSIIENFPDVILLPGEPPVARGRTLGGMSAAGDVRLPPGFLERFVGEFERLLPSGARHCIAALGPFRTSRGFDTRLKFDDIELIRRLSWGHAFGLVGEKVLVSDRRYR